MFPKGYIHDKFFKYKNLLWIVAREDIWRVQLEGVFCEREDCHHQMNIYRDIRTAGQYYAECGNSDCKHRVEMEADNLETTREKAQQLYMAIKRKNWSVESLDLPPTNIKAKDTDQNYWISARIGQKNGKEFGVVYMGRNTKTQTDKEKAQFFLDLEDSEVRHDPGNMFPGDVISSIKVEFKDSTSEQKYK